MLKNTISLFVLLLLSGCALMNQEEMSQRNIAAIQQSEQNISARIEVLSSNLVKQNDYIKSVEKKLSTISQEVTLLKLSKDAHTLNQKNELSIPSNTPLNIAIDTSQSKVSSNIVTTNTETQIRSGMVMLGSLEKIYIDIVKTHFIARVDTGATTSSINAIDMQKFERDGKKWVKFHVSDDETATKDRKWVEAPIVRHVKIRQSTTNELERRPVIELWVKIGSVHEKSQFTLTDRRQMDYPILLGREFIQDVAIVDVSRDFIESKAPKKHLKELIK
jgi:hypothetical protein